MTTKPAPLLDNPKCGPQPNWKRALNKRGIDDWVIHTYKLEAATQFTGGSPQHAGVRYPTVVSGGLRLRWKDLTGKAPNKYEWQTKTADDWKEGAGQAYLYSPEPKSLIEAVTRHNGTLHWMEGEPDCWAMAAYMGETFSFAPATCYFGKAIDLEKIFGMFGGALTDLVIWPDCDEAGLKKAAKVYYAAKAVGITVGVMRLPFEMGSKKDFNDLWIERLFTKESMQASIEGLGTYDEIDMQLYGNKSPNGDSKVSASDELGDAWWRDLWTEYIEIICKKIGNPTGSKRMTCPLPEHPDKKPSFRIARDKGYPMPMCTCDIQNRDGKWRDLATAVGVEAWVDFYKRRLPDKPTSKTPDSPPTPRNGNGVGTDAQFKFTSRKDALAAYEDRLDATSRPAVMPLPLPIKSLYSLGGYCRVSKPGRIVGIVGASGTGKTSFLESLIINPYLQMGEDVIVISPEWTGEEFSERDVQRHDGLTMEDLYLWELWQADKARGVPDAHNRGKNVGFGTLERTKDIARQLAKWPGDAHYLETQGKMTAEAVVGALTQAMRQFPKAKVGVIDYLQLVAEKNTAEVMYDTVLKIKNSAPGRKLLLFAAAQTTKDAARKAAGGKQILDSQAARFINDDPFNLFMTLNLQYEDGVLADHATIYVAKNSIARARQSINVGIDLQHLRWIDKIVEVNENDE